MPSDSQNKAAETFIRLVMEAAKEHEFTSVEIGYSGSGDDGGIENISAMKSDGHIVDLPRQLKDVLQNKAYDLIEEVHSGFGENLGGRGTLSYTVGGALNYERTNYFLKEDTSTIDFEPAELGIEDRVADESPSP